MIAALLLGLAAAGPALPDEVAHQTVSLGWDAQTKSCRARIGSVEIGDPTTEAGEAALTRALAGGQRAVQLQGLAVPYACADSVLSTLRKAGHSVKVGFLSEPGR